MSLFFYKALTFKANKKPLINEVKNVVVLDTNS